MLSVKKSWAKWLAHEGKVTVEVPESTVIRQVFGLDGPQRVRVSPSSDKSIYSRLRDQKTGLITLCQVSGPLNFVSSTQPKVSSEDLFESSPWR